LKKRISDDPGLILEWVTPLVTICFIICVYSYYVDVKKQKEAKETVVPVVLPTTA
jgi:cbb3-type cytochrome oxidase subunit 3